VNSFINANIAPFYEITVATGNSYSLQVVVDSLAGIADGPYYGDLQFLTHPQDGRFLHFVGAGDGVDADMVPGRDVPPGCSAKVDVEPPCLEAPEGNAADPSCAAGILPNIPC